MRLLQLLSSALLLSGCWSPQARLTDCMFGGATKAQAHECAVRNFGAAGEREFRERIAMCNAICGENREMPECAVSCPN